ncbi:MAG: hypothetical protein ACREGH_03815 [Minisyncoccia bacterium]
MSIKLNRQQLDGLLDETAVKFRQTVLDLRQQNIGATRLDGIESLEAILANRTDVDLPETVLRDEDFKTYVYEAVAAKSSKPQNAIERSNALAAIRQPYAYVWQRYNELVP